MGLELQPVLTSAIRQGFVFKQGDWYGHSGELEGWEAYELHNPKTGVTVAVGTNAGAGGSVLIPVLLAQIYPNTGLFG